MIEWSERVSRAVVATEAAEVRRTDARVRPTRSHLSPQNLKTRPKRRLGQREGHPSLRSAKTPLARAGHSATSFGICPSVVSKLARLKPQSSPEVCSPRISRLARLLHDLAANSPACRNIGEASWVHNGPGCAWREAKKSSAPS